MTTSSGADTDDEGITCPACLKYGSEGALQATGMVLTAAEALAAGDDEQITMAYENSTPYDFHFAVTMYLEALQAVSDLIGIDIHEVLADQRRQFNEAVLRGPRHPGSTDPS